jgi:ubiquinone/menaquinone biosynthesis C-methylase UbiE
MDSPSMDHVKNYWENQAHVHKTDHSASWGDRYAINLEIETIARYIQAEHNVLDVGCANGFSTFQQLERQPRAHFVGVDYASEMINQAHSSKQKQAVPDSCARFEVASILELPFEKNTFDVVYTTRVLINLPTWDLQLQGIQECIRATKPGGKVILSEAFWEPLCVLNSMRLLLGLSPLVEHDFNRYLKKDRFDGWLRDNAVQFNVDQFSSVYYFGTRVLRELMKRDGKTEQGYENPINKSFHGLEQDYSFDGLSVQQAYILSI